MNNRMPCITEDERFRLEPDGEEMLLTLEEQRIEWLFDSWADAIQNDTHEGWHIVRSEIYGAIQMLNAIGSLALRGVDPRESLRMLTDVAFQHSRDCIAEGKYEGAPA